MKKPVEDSLLELKHQLRPCKVDFIGLHFSKTIMSVGRVLCNGLMIMKWC